MQILLSTITKRAKCTVPTLFNPANIASLFSAIAFAASARPIGDLILSGMIRFIMHWRLSPGWIDGRGPPGIGLPPPERTPAAHFTRDFIGAQAGLEDGIPGGFNARRETAGIETDAFAIRGLILGHFDQRKGTHD